MKQVQIAMSQFSKTIIFNISPYFYRAGEAGRVPESRAIKCVLLRRQDFSSSPHFTPLTDRDQPEHENWLFIICGKGTRNCCY